MIDEGALEFKIKFFEVIGDEFTAANLRVELSLQRLHIAMWSVSLTAQQTADAFKVFTDKVKKATLETFTFMLSLNLIGKVNEYYGFPPLTAFYGVDYGKKKVASAIFSSATRRMFKLR